MKKILMKHNNSTRYSERNRGQTERMSSNKETKTSTWHNVTKWT